MLVEVGAYALALWLGLYLLGREPGGARLRLAGLGLVTYAVGLGVGALAGAAGGEAAAWLAAARRPLLYLPPLLWSGALIALLPSETAPDEGGAGSIGATAAGWGGRDRLRRWWRFGAWPAAGVLYAAVLVLEGQASPVAAVARWALALLAAGTLLAAGGAVWTWHRAARTRRGLGLLLATAIMFGLSSAYLIAGEAAEWRPWLLALVEVDLLLLGLALAWFDAFEQGERFLPEFLRAMCLAVLATTLLGAPVLAAAVAVGEAHRFAMLALALSVVTLALGGLAFAGRIEAVVERVAFAPLGRLRGERAALLAVAEALPRVDSTFDPCALDDAEFARLTRRALTHLGDLPQLAASPLTRLPAVDGRLARRGAPDTTLERAAELQALLAERIAALKPRDGGEFGTADVWRHYNALHFPYVVGLKPYSRRWQPPALDPTAEKALDWFRRDVPERTLYHWQTAATRLIARDLRAG